MLNLKIMENDDSSLYLKDIADNLWSGHASVIIGAGFSKNASDIFLSWDCLAKVIFKNLYDEEPKEKDNLKLFQGIEADPNKGKDILYKELNKVIPDTTPPSELHTKLLSLPWKDVFTTNYDTLLERTTTTRLYKIIHTEQELNNSSSPRIIKLHGSLPKGPFIITEQDYLSYKNKYPLFENTIQQAFIEDTICLVGFSGDDPNFKKWNYWINNSTNHFEHRIYFISADQISQSDRNILASYNILPIDYFCKKTTSPKKAITHFIEYLESSMPEQVTSKKEYTPNDSSQKWGDKINIVAQKNNYKDILAAWEAERTSYPGWLILPATKRENIYTNIIFFSPTEVSFSELSSPDDIFFLFEFNWRLEKSLHSMPNDLVPVYETVLQKYDPYKKAIITSDTETKKTDPLLDWDKIREAWIALQLSLLRLYREEEWTEKWNNLYKILNEKEDSFSEENKARLNYELCLHYLFTFDIKNLIPAIKNRKVDNSLPYWAAKRATLLAEFCSTEDAIPILKQCLDDVKLKSDSVVKSKDNSLVSLESYLILLYRAVLQSNKIANKDFNFNSLPDYMQRWNELKQYQCDPWGEIEYFKSQLSGIPLKNSNGVEIHATFDIGRKLKIYSENRRMDLSWEYIRFIEETGIPYNLPFIQMLDTKALGKAIYFVSKSSPFVAIIAMVRSGKKENVEYVYDRKTLSTMDSDIINEQAAQYIELLRSTCLDRHQNHENIFSTLSLILPEIISRLCTRISYELRKKLIDLLKDIYKLGILSRLAGYHTLMKRLMDSFTKEEQFRLIPEWLEFPIIDPDGLEFDPFYYMDYYKELTKIRINIKEGAIEDLLSTLKVDDSKRSIAIYRLGFLVQYHLLNDSQMKRFGENLWMYSGKDGFPKQNVYLNFAFISLPHPESISPINLLKTYIKNDPFDPKQNGVNIHGTYYSNSISITDGNIPIFSNIAATDQYPTKYQWTNEEINALACNIINWWNLNNHYFSDEDENFSPSISQEFKQRFRTIEQILTSVIAHNFSEINTENVAVLKNIIDQLPNYGISNLNIKSSLSKQYSIPFSDIEKEIITALSSNPEEIIRDAVRGIYTLAEQEYNITKIMDVVSDNLRCCKREGLYHSITCLKEILKIKYCKYISSNAIQNIELGLAYLKEYTTIKEPDEDLTVNEKLLYKRSIASMLPRLTNYYKWKHQNIPPIVSEWVEIVLNQNEFSDIRNAYINAKGE